EIGRYSSFMDVLANGAGAWLGALLNDRLTRERVLGADAVERLALELPLMGVVYLLIPLLWLDGIAAGTEPRGRQVLTLMLGLSGAAILGTLQSRYFGPRGLMSRGEAARIAGGWFLLGALPALVVRPAVIALCTAVIVALVWLAGGERVPAGGERRFERLALARAAPWFLGYLAVMVTWPPTALQRTWHWSWTLATSPLLGDSSVMLQRIEFPAAMTLLGYVIAESRGRRQEEWRAILRGTAVPGGIAVVVLELVRGFRPVMGASVAEGVLGSMSLCYGAALYYLGRARIREIVRQENARRAARGWPAPDAAVR
ncbi:MAG: hypothetical protein ACOY71_06915, partial [Gemmatimonadota bacterium]